MGELFTDAAGAVVEICVVLPWLGMVVPLVGFGGLAGEKESDFGTCKCLSVQVKYRGQRRGIHSPFDG